jgi:lipid A 4'-phosphatase
LRGAKGTAEALANMEDREMPPKDQRWRELALLAAVAAVLTPIFWLTRLDFWAAGLFYDPALAEPWFAKDVLICRIFFNAPPVLIGAIVVTAGYWFLTGARGPETHGRRRGAVILLAAVLLGPGILVNAVFKNHWGRPRPNHVVEFGGAAAYRPPLLKGVAGAAKSFPAGHPSMAFVFAVYYLVLRERRRRLAQWMLAAAFFGGLAMGAARMAAGAHFLSDVIWSMLITWFAVWAAYYGVVALDARRGRAAAVGRRLGAWQWVAITLGVGVIVAGLLFITPVNRKAVFEWPAGVAVPTTLTVRAPGALVKVRAEPVAAGAAAFGIRHTLQGFGLPWCRLRQATAGGTASAAATAVTGWSYEGLARGVYTELDNILTITVRDPGVRVLRVEISDGTRVEFEGAKPAGLEIQEVPEAAAAGQ